MFKLRPQKKGIHFNSSVFIPETACETDVVPMFLTKPESKIHECSDTVTLQCDVIGSPQPTIRWTKDQQTVVIDNHHKQTFDGRTAVLLITKATSEDSGKYECIAENTSGKSSVDALIVVKGTCSLSFVKKKNPPNV